MGQEILLVGFIEKWVSEEEEEEEQQEAGPDLISSTGSLI